MSISKMAKIKCPACRKEGKFEVWESVNVTLQPELRNRILNRNLFTYVCPHCKHTIFVSYSCLYHDMERKFMVYLINKDEDKEQILKNQNDEQMKNLLENYKVRIVPGISALVEKIGVFEYGLDDHAVELCKAYLYTQYTDLKPNNPLLAIYFAGLNEEQNGLEFYFVSEKEDPSMTIFPRNLYEGILNDVRDSEFYNPKALEIDSNWSKKALLGGVFTKNKNGESKVKSDAK